MRFFVTFILVFAVTYSVFAGAALVFRHQLLYLFDTTPAALANIPRTSIKLLPATGDDPVLKVWVTEPENGKPIIIYFMGNAGSLSIYEPRLRTMAELGFGIAAMAYRGGGGQAGEPSEKALNRDADRVYASLNDLFRREVPASERVIYGFALGSGIAVRLASEVDEFMLVLEAPFSRVCDVVEVYYPLLPACAVMWDERFDSVDLIGDVESPILFLHGTEDFTIPLSLGEKLYMAAKDPKFTKIYARGGHEDLGRFGSTEDMARLIGTLRGER